VEHFEDRDVALKLIVLYKIIKAFLQLVGATLLFVENQRGRVMRLADDLATWVGGVQVMHDAAAGLGHWMVSEITPSRIAFGIALLALDGCMTFVEGVGLHYRQKWAAWLVVVATSTFIPLEIWWLVRRTTVVRGVILVLNIAIVIYLMLRVLAHQRRDRQAGPGEAPNPAPTHGSDAVLP
jgi:uncharacterized membrane protein (DUF2068 family)